MANSLPEDSKSRSVWKYDVFLSFRGTDVRRKFISHLNEALTDEGIVTFHDNRDLERGDSILRGLEEAMNQSRYAIVVVSEDYATSQWCLRELSFMVELAGKTKRFKLIPIFYDIDPSALKSRTGCFNKAFEDHEQRFDGETVSEWRRAVGIVANVSSWVSKTSDDAKLIQEVVRDLCERLYAEPSDDTSEFVGMTLHKKRIESLLSTEDSSSDDVKMVGVWGMGGRGKTTIAKCVYESLSTHFPSRCFLGNVKGESSSHLRKQIMSEIFPKSPLNARCVSPEAMKRRLRGKKVLLILDDVDDVQQLQELAGDCKWFGPGSRVIITTRDKRVLDEHSVKHIYEVKPLRTTQALQLFSRHAFKTNRPPQDEFRQLCLDIVEQLCGLPLALRAIGASLYNRSIAFWEDKLCILRNSLDKSISTVLKVSYDALDEHEKTVFLYVAGCFNGEYMDRASMVLDPFVIRSKPRLVTLMEKSMISMSNNTRLWVHDLLRDMANDITCEGKMNKMMWNFLDIKGLFTENVGNKEIEVESIFLNMAEETGLCVNPETFKRMRKLKFLKIHSNLTAAGSKVCIVDEFDYLPPLRYLHWEAYTLKSLPAKFETNFLVELNLPDSSVETLWTGSQDLGSLRHMNLNRCRNLIEVPDLSKARSLECLCLCDCESLVELPSSLGLLDKLVKLSMLNCKKLKSLPSNIKLKSLKTLSLDGCINIEEFPFVSDVIEELGLRCTSIELVPDSISRLEKLTELRLSHCKRLKNLPETFGDLNSLKHLTLTCCPNITVFPMLGDGVETVSLNGTLIEEVPSWIGCKVNLTCLDMSECKKLHNLPHSLRNLKNLKLLYLRGCVNITEIPQVAGEMRRLDLYGTSIEKYGVLSEEEALVLDNRDMDFLKRLLTRYVRSYKRKRDSR
ncbi:protein SUPPRESSOR OF npr1-1, CONSTITUTIVE 1-like isoform X2 [Raphanus sativus]|uniref:Protein SUPPRESSOR OF npr1-1, CONSTITUTIVE 1-like isoform X2 n=1 Tax=Raphanus sativus TaxID=3726 RepID=A0A9W3C329_RAPSA|nr:protein SUPPRESSOR OF npr1-1, CONSTITUTIVE 1-like isoform X2 [Raphanus sativus]